MKSYYRIMLGRKSVFADDCREGGFIGADFDVNEDLEGQLPDNFRDFNHVWIPKIIAQNPGTSRIAAGLAGGALHTMPKVFALAT